MSRSRGALRTTAAWPGMAVSIRTIAVLCSLAVVGCGPGPEGGTVSGEAPPESASGQPASEALDSATREAVLTAARSVLDAINESDPELLREVMAPDAAIVSVAPGRAPATTTVDQMASMLADPSGDLVERMWDPRVESDGTVASVWAPYDFYRGGELSHCGVDAFQLARTDTGWRVQTIVYSHLQPPACETHPEGPPGG